MIKITPSHYCTKKIKGHHRDKSLKNKMLLPDLFFFIKKEKSMLTDFAEKVKKGRNIIANCASGNCVHIAPKSAIIEPD